MAKRYTVYSKVPGKGWHAVTIDLEDLANVGGDLSKIEEMIQAAPSGGHVVPALERAAVPIETMLTDPELLLHSRERLGAFIDGLDQRERPADRYRKLLDGLD